jgi:hypothetical protein
LANAQFLIAEAHGFENWTSFVRHLEEVTGARPSDNAFEAAADAVVGGDLATLASLIRQHPDLVYVHSARVHHATLLHYVAANGVEDFRQKTPANAVAIARFLLDAGAEVDALADTYGSDAWQTTMNLLVSSTHPAEAGLQSALVEILLDHGAAIDGLKNDCSPLLTALAFGYSDAAETLARRGARVDSVLLAAALGRTDLAKRFVVDKATLAPGVPLVAPHWLGIPDNPAAHIAYAFVWACRYARVPVAEFLLDIGVDPAAKDSLQMSALHWAAANGCMGLVNRLLELGASLELENQWGGTVLGSTAHFAIYIPMAGVDYVAVMERLIAAGADVNAAYPSGGEAVDELLRRHGARGR